MPATSLTRASWNGWASTTASPPRISLRPDRRSTSRSRPRPTASIGTSRTASMRCPPSARGPSPAKPGLPAWCVTTPTTTSSCTTRRRRSRAAISASAWPRPCYPRALTATTRRNPSCVRTGSATAIRLSPTATTAAASTRTSSPICPDRTGSSGRATATTSPRPCRPSCGRCRSDPTSFRRAPPRRSSCRTTRRGRAASSKGPTCSRRRPAPAPTRRTSTRSSIPAATRAPPPTPSAGPAALPVRLPPAPTSRRPDHY